jgi:hypothetical protein
MRCGTDLHHEAGLCLFEGLHYFPKSAAAAAMGVLSLLSCGGQVDPELGIAIVLCRLLRRIDAVFGN